jgi:soluble lytic murein transglycosylase-like protein
MVKSEIRAKIEAAAKVHSLDADLVEAFCLVESSADPKATRYEPAFFKTYIFPIAQTMTESEAKGRATSWGLMQIMGQVARELGFGGTLESLLIAENGLDWGCKFLKRKIDKYHAEGLDAAIAAYNAGTPHKNAKGLFYNQGYVDKVRQYYRLIRHVG